jgi:hypothetical protein
VAEQPIDQPAPDAVEVEPGEAPLDAAPPPDVEDPEIEPVPIDTTAELLGRAKPKRPRARASTAIAAAASRAARRPGVRKAAAPRRPARPRKARGGSNDDVES